MDTLVILILVAIVAFQIWVTRCIWRTSVYDRDQKWGQTRLIWLVPLLGAVLVYFVFEESNRSFGGKF